MGTAEYKAWDNLMDEVNIFKKGIKQVSELTPYNYKTSV